MNLGDTMIWAPPNCPNHLYIAISDPQKNDGDFVILNLTDSVQAQYSFILRAGDHPFIYKDSDVNFGDAILVSLETINYEITIGKAIPREPMDMKIVQKIIERAKTHPAFTPIYRKYF